MSDSRAILRPPPTELAGLVRSRDRARADELVIDVAARFERERHLEALAIVEKERPIGLIGRTELLLRLSHQFGHALYSKSPITQLADPEPLVMSGDLSLDEAVRRAARRGSERAHDRIVVVDEEGAYEGLISVTELMEHQGIALEEARREEEISRARARELERVDDLRERFLATVTHELRAPVNAMIGAAEVVARAFEQEDQSTMEQLLPMLISTGTGLRQLINNVLDLSKLQAGKMRVMNEPIPVTELLQEIHVSALSLAGRSDLEIGLVAPDPSETLFSDPIKLKQILMNLTSNAIKFTEAGRISIGARSFDGGWSFWVEDSGRGIASEDLEGLCEAFYQVESASEKRCEGTGLGLTIVRDLVALLGGALHAESLVGEGSLFEVCIPDPATTAHLRDTAFGDTREEDDR